MQFAKRPKNLIIGKTVLISVVIQLFAQSHQQLGVFVFGAANHPKAVNQLQAYRKVAKRPVAIRYHSMSSGESERVIVPFALVDSGLRWHVRAFDRKSGEFRDFVVTRIEASTLLDEEPQANEQPDNDIQWTRIVELDFVPHPRLERPEIIKMDYGMTDGSIRMRVRAAVAGYMLQHWRVDCSPDHRLKEEQYRLWLSDPLALYGVENAKLAPGYQDPAAKISRKG